MNDNTKTTTSFIAICSILMCGLFGTSEAFPPARPDMHSNVLSTWTPPQSFCTSSPMPLFAAPINKNSRKSAKTPNQASKEEASPSSVVKVPPLVVPILVLGGLDIILNILVLIKRTYDAVVLGQAPSTEAWW